MNTKTKLVPPENPRTETPEFISERGREFYVEQALIPSMWVIKSPERGGIPEPISGFYTRKDVAEEALKRFLLESDKTGKAVTK